MGHGQMSEALQRFLREEEVAGPAAEEGLSDAEGDVDIAQAFEKLDLGNLDITSTAISLQGEQHAPLGAGTMQYAAPPWPLCARP